MTTPTTIRHRVSGRLFAVHAWLTEGYDDTVAGAEKRMDFRDDRGDITPRTVGIAIMTAAAVAALTAVAAKIATKETTISLD